MENISLIKLDKYKNSTDYKFIEDGVYQDLKDPDDTKYRMSISYELENNENTQFPLEDILDKYFLYVSDFLENLTEKNKISHELAGELQDIKKAKEIIGKSVFSIDAVENGETYIKLVIE